MNESVSFFPIAHIRTDFPEKFGIPRQSGRTKKTKGRIVFLPEFREPEALREITGFSHLWLLFDFSLAHRDNWSATVRPPRLGGNRRVGVFASRSPFRPNPIGLSCVELCGIEKTEKEGTVIIVSGADLLDNTPIFDIKPYLPFADCHPEALSGYAGEFEHYRLDVSFPEFLAAKLEPDILEAIKECLSEDPRPSYQNDPQRIYTMRFSTFDISFKVENKTLFVTDVKIL